MTHKKAVISFSIERLLGPAFSTPKANNNKPNPYSVAEEKEEEINIEESSEDENEDDENKGCYRNTGRGCTTASTTDRVGDASSYTIIKNTRLDNPPTSFSIPDKLAGIIILLFLRFSKFL